MNYQTPGIADDARIKLHAELTKVADVSAQKEIAHRVIVYGQHDQLQRPYCFLMDTESHFKDLLAYKATCQSMNMPDEFPRNYGKALILKTHSTDREVYYLGSEVIVIIKHTSNKTKRS